jgi:DnaJ-class molecular chaperone
MELFKADRCRALSDECRGLALVSEDEHEKNLLTNLSLSWNRIANQTDRYAEFMNRPKEKGRGDQVTKTLAKPTERKCPACNGTGFPPVKQPAEPSRKIYPPRCERCDGKGWITESN